MLRKIVFVGMALFATASGLGACAGPMGKGEGDSCSSQDDCSTDLTCQPIQGHGDVCCPAPPDNSSKSSCHAQVDGG